MNPIRAVISYFKPADDAQDKVKTEGDKIIQQCRENKWQDLEIISLGNYIINHVDSARAPSVKYSQPTGADCASGSKSMGRTQKRAGSDSFSTGMAPNKIARNTPVRSDEGGITVRVLDSLGKLVNCSADELLRDYGGQSLNKLLTTEKKLAHFGKGIYLEDAKQIGLRSGLTDARLNHMEYDSRGVASTFIMSILVAMLRNGTFSEITLNEFIDRISDQPHRRRFS